MFFKDVVAKWCIQIKLRKKTERNKQWREKGKWKERKKKTGFSNAMAKIAGKGRRQELSGNYFPVVFGE